MTYDPDEKKQRERGKGEEKRIRGGEREREKIVHEQFFFKSLLSKNRDPKRREETLNAANSCRIGPC
jgi:hypothetical protein